MQSDFDKNLLNYFTDVEHLRDAFKTSVAAPTLTKRLLVIHGVGGVGKSSLLRMFRLHCKGAHVPAALASGDEAKSALDILYFKSPTGEEHGWVPDLKADGVRFPKFNATFEHYRAIQAKVDEQVKKAQDTRGRMADIAGKAASKTAETAGGALMGAALGSVIPGIGTAIGGALGGVLGGMGAEALVDWLRGFLTKPDVDLLLDPSKKLTSDFLEDLAKAAEKRRIVVMLDAFEQMTALDDWARDVAQRIHPNVLLAIAGRKLPDWNRTWQDWMAIAQVEELKPMTEEIMGQLIRRYYATMRGGEPDPVQVEAIVRIARGLPIVVTGVVQLWVKYDYDVDDFQSVKTEVIANFVDWLMEGVQSTLIPALEAAAVLRWFDQPILRAVTGLENVRDVYNELRRFPFVRTRVEGLALHDSVREMIDENLRVQDSERHSELHKRAAVYFEKRLENATGEEAERLGLERLYHRVRADEKAGIKLFQEMAEELARFRLVNQLRAIVNDANTYPLEIVNSVRWREYYDARLAFFDLRWADAEAIYQKIDQDSRTENKLRAYALCDLADYWIRPDRLTEQGGVERALDVLERCRKLIPDQDSKLVLVLSRTGNVYSFMGQHERTLDLLEQQRRLSEQHGNNYGVVFLFDQLRQAYGIIGDWKKSQASMAEGLHILKTMPENQFLRARLTGYNQWCLIWSGRYAAAEGGIRAALDLAEQMGDLIARPVILKELGLALGVQERYEEAEKCFAESIESYERRGSIGFFGLAIGLSFWGPILVRQGKLDQAADALLRCLSTKKKINDNIGIPEIVSCMGELHELSAKYKEETRAAELSKANSYYRQALEYRWTGRRYFECAALTGLARIKQAQRDYAAITPLLAEAEELAQQYEYNDHLASLRLTQSHLAWETGKRDEAISFYKHTMIYALRYNRFLLDELLSGRSQGTPLRPIIPYCLEHSEEGKKFLIALRDWWKTGVNDIGTLRPDTISPIPEGIPLLEAEKIAREHEPGDGSTQKSVIEQIETVL